MQAAVQAAEQWAPTNFVLWRGRFTQWLQGLGNVVALTVAGAWVWWHVDTAPVAPAEPAFVTLLVLWTFLVLVMNLRLLALVVETRPGRTAWVVTLLALGLLAAIRMWWSLHPAVADCLLTRPDGRCAPLAEPVGVAALIILLAISGVIALLALHPRARPALTGPVEIRRPELVICCSGGGIRSASFCLGALQRLQRIRLYQHASQLIAVSGGGYIAGAVAALQRPEAEPGSVQPEPFAVDSPEVARLRRHTTYLASSARVRFDAVASLLYGLLVNVLLVGTVLWFGAWLLSWQIGYSQLITVQADRHLAFHVHREPDWAAWAWIPAAGSAIIFLVDRLRDRVPHRQADRSRERFFPKPDGHALDVVFGRRLTLGWLANARNALLITAAVMFLLVPVVPRTAVWLSAHHWPGHLGSGLVHDVVAVTAFAGSVVTLLRSTQKDQQRAQPVTQEDGAATRALAYFRSQIAPRLASVIVGLGLFVFFTTRVAYFAAHPRSQANYSEAWIPGTVFASVWLVATANTASLFPFYRDRLASAFLLRSDGRNVRAQRRAERERFSELQANRAVRGGPELVLCATANVLDPDLLPVGRGGTPFVFSDEIGLTDAALPSGNKRVPARDYDNRSGAARITVAHAMAISGAALAPVAGRDNHAIRPFRFLLAVINVRMGSWIPNPYWVSHTTRLRRALTWPAAVLDAPSVLQVVREALGAPSLYAPHLYVTDGGHYDNLGLVEALRRRPERIIVLDASGDPEDGFATIGSAIATARMDLGVEIEPFDISPLIRGSRPHAAASCLTLHASFDDDGTRTRIDYVKSLLVDGLSWDLYSYKGLHRQFPLTATADQLFDEFDFEAYRQLGYSLIELNERSAGWCALADRLAARADPAEP